MPTPDQQVIDYHNKDLSRNTHHFAGHNADFYLFYREHIMLHCFLFLQPGEILVFSVSFDLEMEDND